MRSFTFATSLLFVSLASPLPAQVAAQHPYRQQIVEMDRMLSSVKQVSGANLSADGTMVAWSSAGKIEIAPIDESHPAKSVTASNKAATCDEHTPVWSPDAQQLAFLSDCNTPGQVQLYVAERGKAWEARSLTHLKGAIAHPQWSPDGAKIAFLFVADASRAPSPMSAIKAPTGVIDDQETTEIQHVMATDLTSGESHELTPPALYIFEFAWSPNSQMLAYTAAPPPGDDNWYIAQLYTQSVSDAKVHLIYKPPLQIALPQWSPNGKSIAFIAGLMSDEGATGGEIYVVPATGGEPKDLTPSRLSTPSWFTWRSDSSMLFTEFKGGSSAISLLDLSIGNTKTLWEGGETIQAGTEATSLSVASVQTRALPVVALTRALWSSAAEVWAGPIGKWHQITHENSQLKTTAVRAESISWKNDSFQVQGWLVYPSDFDSSKRYPMIVSIHGGPAWIFTPRWPATDFDLTALSNLGYFIFFPNPRGSFGQGERFTQANRRDWGFGDLSDVTSGVDAVLARQPVDKDRVGVLGWSYGGSTALFAVTRTHRFRAAVAGASACNLFSYYGENSIDQWMLPYFGASAYDDPAAYIRSSALTYVKQAKTPTLILVGERDGEAPPAQSFEMWHALKTMHVPTQLVVYPGEGHAFGSHADRVDLVERSLEWFMRYMPPN